MRALILIIITVFIISSCEQSIVNPPQVKEECTSSIVKDGRYYQINDQEFLWAGEDSTTHFNITDWSLDECNLNNGLGRETFKALLEPKFVPISSVLDNYTEHERALVLRGSDIVKVYPNNTLREYETLNDNIDGINVIVVYCFIAELTAVYNTTYCGKDLTFGVSGYTYKDPGLDENLESFLLWDRETESLWWPISEEGVSGAFQGELLRKYKKNAWEEIPWPDVVKQYPDAMVLKTNIDMDPPINWPKIDPCE